MLLKDFNIGYFEVNLKGRDFVVGDVHGEFYGFKKALETLDFKFEVDRVFCVGDLIDRGPNSHQMLILLKEKWFYSVLGNHEQLLLENHDNNNKRELFWFPYGGKWWLELSSEERTEMVALIMQKMYLALSVVCDDKTFGVVHADMPSDTDWPALIANIKTDVRIQREAMWSRRTIKQKLFPDIVGIDFVVCGHSPQNSPTLSGNIVHLDTGSGYKINQRLPTPALTFLELGSELKYHRFEL
jgi:serine/threonine protein phosphatase 1